MSTKPNKLKKGLLLSTAALILSTPVCMAQSALASTGGSSSFVKNQSQPQLQTALAKLQQILPKTSQGLRLLSSNTLPSDTEISSLETILESQPDSFYIIDKKLKVNILDSTITLTGHKLNQSTWIVPGDSVGDHYIISHNLSKKDIFDTLEYLYHILSNN
jgi:hypothetical protein